ncbi:hypothetical protein STEG23_012249, partial [Scotinomys teguina]
MDKENVVHIYTMEYYAAEKNNDIMKFAGKWMELENVILSEKPLKECNGELWFTQILRRSSPKHAHVSEFVAHVSEFVAPDSPAFVRAVDPLEDTALCEEESHGGLRTPMLHSFSVKWRKTIIVDTVVQHQDS